MKNVQYFFLLLCGLNIPTYMCAMAEELIPQEKLKKAVGTAITSAEQEDIAKAKIQEAIQAKASINGQGASITPLHIACKKSSEGIVEFLIYLKASADKGTKAMGRPLEVAISANRPTIAEILLRNNADPNPKSLREVGPWGRLTYQKPYETEDFKLLLLRFGAHPCFHFPEWETIAQVRLEKEARRSVLTPYIPVNDLVTIILKYLYAV